METGGSCSRRRLSLSEDKVDSPNLRDFLRLKDDDGRNLTGLTLMEVLKSEKRPPMAQVNRTLLDIIRDDPNYAKDSKKSWKAFKAKLRLRRAAAAWASAIPIPVCDVPVQNSVRIVGRRDSTRLPTTVSNSENSTSASTQSEVLSSSSSVNRGENRAESNWTPSNRTMMLGRNSSQIPPVAACQNGREVEGTTSVDRSQSNSGETRELLRQLLSAERSGNETEEGVGETREPAAQSGEPSVRMSLMALLAETDGHMGMDGSPLMVDEEEEGDEVQEEEEIKGVACGNCCVCMVRHKGAAFIPCGHTFCRLCSRELWVQRGNCPLCNGFILEILDIF